MIHVSRNDSWCFAMLFLYGSVERFSAVAAWWFLGLLAFLAFLATLGFLGFLAFFAWSTWWSSAWRSSTWWSARWSTAWWITNSYWNWDWNWDCNWWTASTATSATWTTTWLATTAWAWTTATWTTAWLLASTIWFWFWFGWWESTGDSLEFKKNRLQFINYSIVFEFEVSVDMFLLTTKANKAMKTKVNFILIVFVSRLFYNCNTWLVKSWLMLLIEISRLFIPKISL